MINKAQLHAIALKDKPIKNLLDKIKSGNATNITFECLRVALHNRYNITLTGKQLKNIII